MSETGKRSGPGRRSVGPRVHVRLPRPLLAEIDGIVAERAAGPNGRAQIIRELIEEGLAYYYYRARAKITRRDA